jgi:beta-phosphoglucomutase-like phosphatase (HAD superfamily)
LISAKEAGLQVWAVPNRVTQCLDFSEADRVFGSLTEVISILQDDA